MTERHDDGSQPIQWFPGHMAKTLRLMEHEVHEVDCVIQLLDARIPLSSQNPEIQRIVKAKPCLFALTKADLADPSITKEWVHFFRTHGEGCVAIDAHKKGDVASVRGQILKTRNTWIAKRSVHDMQGAVRVMIVGIPNVGKSTFINAFVGGAHAKVENRPGVTRGKQWIHGEGFDLLDMPGVLWKQFNNRQTAAHLAFTGAIRDEILDIEDIACGLLDSVKELYPEQLLSRYHLPDDAILLPSHDLLLGVARKRGMLLPGGMLDTQRAAQTIVGEFRARRWGRISLEQPPHTESDDGNL